MKHRPFGAVSSTVAIVWAFTFFDSSVLAKAEEAEFVRVCDAFGEGYFYLPGTETCLKIGGYVRLDLGWGELPSRYGGGLDTDGDGLGDAWRKRARYALQVATASDTELGTLSTFFETDFDYETREFYADLNFDGFLDYAGYATQYQLLRPYIYVQLGGLRVGKDDSVFASWTDFAGNMLHDDYGRQPVPFETFPVLQLNYRFDVGNGISAIVSLEDDAGFGEAYLPDIVVGAKYENNNWKVSAVLGYEESTSNWAAKLRLDVKAGDLSAFVMAGRGSSRSGYFQTWFGDWAIWTGASYELSERVALNAQFAYDEAEIFGTAANVVFSPASGFDITSEIFYEGGENGRQSLGGIFRFQRDF